MQISRRALLQGVIGAGALHMLPGLALADGLRQATVPTVILLGGSPWDNAFVIGVRQGRRLCGATEPNLAATTFDGPSVYPVLHAALRQPVGTRVIGLLDEGNYVVFAALARSRGARRLYEGVHSRHGTMAQCHQLQVSSSFGSVAEHLAQALDGTPGAWLVRERPFHASVGTGAAVPQAWPRRTLASTAGWAGPLGLALASIENSPLTPVDLTPRGYFQGLGDHREGPRREAIVSFVVET
jgi:hypothetical protein